MPLPSPEQLVAAALGCSTDTIGPESALAVHPNWDSFGHLMVMLKLEEYYDVSITDETIRRYESMASIRERYDELSHAGGGG